VVGLKPGHFYNIKVFAVGSNNFQTGSQVIRVRTYGRDGRPILENGRTPTNFSVEEPSHTPEDSSDDAPSRTHTAGIEPATLPDTSQVSKRDSLGHSQGQRRNTIGRKHSPSNAATEHTFDPRKLNEPEESMQQLTEKFEAIRRDTEEVVAQMSKDAEDFRIQIEELTKDKDEKRQALKEKEDASEKLRKDINIAERDNRAAQTRKRDREKYLRDKENSKRKMQDDMTRWKEEIEEMKKQQEQWMSEKELLKQTTEEKAEELRGTIRKRQNSLNGLDNEIHVKGVQVAELERKRQQLPGAQDDEGAREREEIQKQQDDEWERKQRELTIQLNTLKMTLQHLDADLFHQNQILAGLQARVNPQLMYHGNSSGVDLDPTNSQGKAKPRRSRNRKSRTNTVSSPSTAYPMDPIYSTAGAYSGLNSTASPTFAPGPYFGFSHHDDALGRSHLDEMSDADRKAFGDGAPLSPTASRWLPSDILQDTDPLPSALLSALSPGLEHETQTPESSSRSASIFSSPHGSTNNLALYGVTSHDADGDRRSLNSARAEFGAIGSPTAKEEPAPARRYLPDMFQRNRGKTMQDGFALGSLKPSQSQSFPRSGEEPVPLLKARRSSLSWTGKPMFAMSGIFGKTWGMGESTQGNAPALARTPATTRQRGLAGLFNRSTDESAITDRNPTSPRPASVASSELPRPSVDSAPFGWSVSSEVRNSPLNPNWSMSPQQPWSNAPSRRTSVQYGSTTALTGIASDDDDFLPTSAPQSKPPAAGVIGTRPLSSHQQATPKLNPTATPFMAQISRVFTSKGDKEKRDKGKDKAIESPPDDRPGTSLSLGSLSRMSRDTPSIHTQNSVSESHESLRLERTSSNTPSEIATPSATSKEKEVSSLSKLMRKGSSKAISLAGMRRKDSSLFGTKKNAGSASNSDRNFSGERDSSMDEFGEDGLGKSIDSVTSSPMIGSVDSKMKDGRESRRSMNWGRFPKFGKGKGRESSEIERSEAETTGTEDEGND
jgi:hypothetical protein